MKTVQDDFDSAPGSTTSLLRSIIGTSLRRLGGWIAVADLIELMAAAGVPEARTRTALSRVKAKGLLSAEPRHGIPGYRLSPAATPMLERGDDRIYYPRTMTADGRWCLISWSVPEEKRDLRHQLRRRLTWIGCGAVSPALWICPEYLTTEVEDILADLGLSRNATLFLSDEVRGPRPPREAVAGWWDLDAVRALHHDFLDAHEEEVRALGPNPALREAFSVWVRGLDSWRKIPYLDPGLPPELLPADWPGRRSVPVFHELRDRILPLAHAYVDEVTGPAPTTDPTKQLEALG
ncbi:PaaX family transcriptional regulator C-terminal domain-containing protein [Kineosporia sp. NBRC 101731]|uniref:PaaX family transcriptional regulator n=1 Tax=Kineosporia sp. NBRC 101731 TaxID=3032199 RepID=UPI0024A1E293|nr:PaaX family transcriptional regulator C-terminal domain-containing protein [Kineosporia sp. NBRC 101731]GLY31031.1 PaaX family transcriptional regulator [Kineosporia sp. NBRC 101731]